ncbi:MAG: hypothetical protein JXR76_12065 [Deltaproteobacteria bacterium]|nr:hypothetical protein [Deltaproteobacteria bacterium]
MNTSAIVYDQMMHDITAIPAEKTLSPTMPMDIYIQEALNLHTWASTDRAQLLQAGLCEDLLDDLPFRADAASEAQSIWRNFLVGQSEAQHRWNADSPEAFDLREELIHAMRFAYRESNEIRTQIEKIADETTEINLIDDLHALATIGRANPRPLRLIGFELAKVEHAAVVSQGMQSLKTGTSYGSNTDDIVQTVRDKAYTHLKEAVDAVRECGQYVFWKDKIRSKGYRSEYVARARRREEDITQPFVIAPASGE